MSVQCGSDNSAIWSGRNVAVKSRWGEETKQSQSHKLWGILNTIWFDVLTDEEILRWSQQFVVLHQLRTRWLQCRGHVQCAKEGTLFQKFCRAEVDGSSALGQPWMRLEDVVLRDLRSLNTPILTLDERRRLVWNHSRWKSILHATLAIAAWDRSGLLLSTLCLLLEYHMADKRI